MKPCGGLGKGVIVLAVAAFVLGGVVLLPSSRASGQGGAADRTFTVLPTGGDDTGNIQAAFDACAASGERCTVQLGTGTFHTAQVVVRGFHGTFRGMGEPWTVLEALPDLPVVFDFLRLPSRENPYPMLFVFIEGTFAISDMTISEPWPEPLVEWLPCADCPTMHAMHSVVTATGGDVEVTVRHVTLVGAPGDCPWNGLNTINGIIAMALLMAPGGSDITDILPVHPTFLATDNAFYTVGSPLGFENTVGARVSARDNVFDTTDYPFGFIDAADGVFEFSHNVARNVFLGAAVQAWQGMNTFFELFPFGVPSRLIVTDNDLQVTNIAQGVLLLDYGEFSGYARTLDAVITGNIIRTDETSLEGVLGVFQRSTLVAGNEIVGPGPVGVRLYGSHGAIVGNAIRGGGIGVLVQGSTGVRVDGNEVRDSGLLGIALVDGSSDVFVAGNVVKGSGAFDLFWDGFGSGNVWRGNTCETSEPPGLCTAG